MLITKKLKNFGKLHPRSIVAFGVFDGLHRGHRALIKSLVARARAVRANSVVLTFDPHPRLVLSRERWPMLLTTLAEKERLLAGLGVDIMGIIQFSRATAAMRPEDFVRKVLAGELAAAEVVCGRDCGFGRGRRGGLALLAALGREHGFTVDPVRPLRRGGLKISSTKIRRALLAGQLAAANEMLGRPYQFSGTVVRGHRIGRGLGYRTANVKIGDRSKLVPADGVYAAAARIGARMYRGMLYIGSRPTFRGHGRQIEFHAFGAKGDLYGRAIDVRLMKFIRPDRKFGNAEQLRLAIGRDERAIRRYFSRTRLTSSRIGGIRIV
ncbi:MAG TPA: riboflavin biosynthesis protein RibF [Candidatus Edwardsbacteria bacterium]|nr:riboflavin biosynthesis protein RibF [Candidatus Edwardsbacteria bacterium]